MQYEEHAIQIVNTYVIPWSINILIALLIFLIGRVIISIISNLVGRALSHTKWDIILVEFVQQLIRAILLIFVIVAALDQLGVNTTSVIAVLGAAGLAIGLALQGSLQNFAAGFMLLVFRPFKSGDFIEAAGTMGVVEKIHIFSTIMRTGDNKEVIVPNGAIYSGKIINYSTRETRRIDMVFSISYNDDIRKARDIMMGIINAEERVMAEPKPLIAVSELTASSVDFIVRPWVRTEDYWPVKYSLTEQIKLAFDENGITIPYQQMDVHLIKPE